MCWGIKMHKTNILKSCHWTSFLVICLEIFGKTSQQYRPVPRSLLSFGTGTCLAVPSHEKNIAQRTLSTYYRSSTDFDFLLNSAFMSRHQ